MEEIELMFQNGDIDAATYHKLRQKVDPNYQDPYAQTKRATAEANAYISGQESTGLGRGNIGGDTSKSIQLDQEELESYTSRGIAPSYGVDYQNIRAERQTWQDQLANGVTKAVGKTATGVAGGLAGLPSLLGVGYSNLKTRERRRKAEGMAPSSSGKKFNLVF